MAKGGHPKIMLLSLKSSSNSFDNPLFSRHCPFNVLQYVKFQCRELKILPAENVTFPNLGGNYAEFLGTSSCILIIGGKAAESTQSLGTVLVHPAYLAELG